MFNKFGTLKHFKNQILVKCWLLNTNNQILDKFGPYKHKMLT